LAHEVGCFFISIYSNFIFLPGCPFFINFTSFSEKVFSSYLAVFITCEVFKPPEDSVEKFSSPADPFPYFLLILAPDFGIGVLLLLFNYFGSSV